MLTLCLVTPLLRAGSCLIPMRTVAGGEPSAGGATCVALNIREDRGRAWHRCIGGYSTVTDLARLRGWSTSVPFATAA